MRDFEVSAMNMRAFSSGLEASGRRAEVLSKLTPEARAAYDAPFAVRWHPGRYAVSAWEHTYALGSEPLLTQVNDHVSRNSFGPVVRPLARVALAISGASPATLFSRLGSIVALAVRGLSFGWESRSRTSGSLTVTYPRPVPGHLLGWPSVIRAGADLAGVPIILDAFRPRDGHPINTIFTYDVHW